jgi:hypothetical protein
MQAIREWFQGKKTYVLALIAVLTGVAELFGVDVVPEVTQDNAISYIWAALGMSTLRAGLAAKSPSN